MSVASQASLNQSLAGRSLTSYFTGSTQLASFSENRTLRWALANTEHKQNLWPAVSTYLLQPACAIAWEQVQSQGVFCPHIFPASFRTSALPQGPQRLPFYYQPIGGFYFALFRCLYSEAFCACTEPMTEASKEKEEQTEAVEILRLKMQGVGLPWWLSGKESTCQCGRCRFDPWVRRAPGEGNGNPLQYSCLRNPVDRSLAGYSPWGRKRVRHDLVTKQQWQQY